MYFIQTSKNHESNEAMEKKRERRRWEWGVGGVSGNTKIKFNNN